MVRDQVWWPSDWWVAKATARISTRAGWPLWLGSIRAPQSRPRQPHSASSPMRFAFHWFTHVVSSDIHVSHLQLLVVLGWKLVFDLVERNCFFCKFKSPSRCDLLNWIKNIFYLKIILIRVVNDSGTSDSDSNSNSTRADSDSDSRVFQNPWFRFQFRFQ